MKRLSRLSLLLAILIALSTVFTADVCTTKAQAAIRISNTGAVVPIGMTKRLYVGGVSGKVRWTTSNKNIATVSSSGVVKGKKTGTCKITAKASGQTIKCYIRVINRYNAWQVGNVVLSRVKQYYPYADLTDYSRSGNRILLNICRPQCDGAPGCEMTVNISTGKATWYDYWDDFFGKMPRTFNVWVCNSPKTAVTKITLNRTKATIVKGKTITLKATISPSGASDKSIKWSSSNKKVATVTSKGVVKGIKPGTATITARAADGSGKKAVCKVTVKKASSGVPNVTDAVMKKKYADAAKYLKLTQKVRRYNSEYGFYEYYYIRKGRKLFDGSPALHYLNSSYVRGGEWDLLIEDKSTAFQGVKVGMSASKAKSLLKKKWKFATSFSDAPSPGCTRLIYERQMNFSFTWDGSVSLFLDVKKGKIISIGYYTIEGL